MSNTVKDKRVQIYISIDLYNQIDSLLHQHKFSNITDYLRYLIRKDLDDRKRNSL